MLHLFKTFHDYSLMHHGELPDNQFRTRITIMSDVWENCSAGRPHMTNPSCFIKPEAMGVPVLFIFSVLSIFFSGAVGDAGIRPSCPEPSSCSLIRILNSCQACVTSDAGF